MDSCSRGPLVARREQSQASTTLLLSRGALCSDPSVAMIVSVSSPILSTCTAARFWEEAMGELLPAVVPTELSDLNSTGLYHHHGHSAWVTTGLCCSLPSPFLGTTVLLGNWLVLNTQENIAVNYCLSTIAQYPMMLVDAVM